VRMSIWIAAFGFVTVFMTASDANAQLFGERTLGGGIGRRVRAEPLEQAGQVTGSERFIRGNRAATDIVGADSGDSGGFVGSQQAESVGRVPAATEDLREERDRSGTLNRARKKRRARDMYPPRLVVGFTTSVRPPTTIQRSLDRLTRRSPTFASGGSISVRLNGTTAHLTGSVGSNRAKRMAEALVLFEPGITDVRNEIAVLPSP